MVGLRARVEVALMSSGRVVLRPGRGSRFPRSAERHTHACGSYLIFSYVTVIESIGFTPIFKLLK